MSKPQSDRVVRKTHVTPLLPNLGLAPIVGQ